MGWPCDSCSANINTPLLEIDGLLASMTTLVVEMKLDAMRMTYGQDTLVIKWSNSLIMSHSFQDAYLRAMYSVWLKSHIAYLVRN